MVGLVQEAAGLGLGVLAVAVGEEIDPDLAGPGLVPDPDLAAGHVVIQGPVAHARVASLVPGAVEILPLADGEVALGVGRGVGPVPGQVPALRIHGPGLERDVVVVADLPAAGEDVAQVVGRRNGPAGPVVVGLAEGRGIVPSSVGLEVGFVLGQPDRDAPAGPGGKVHGPDDTADAAVGIAAQDVVHGRGRRGGMADDAEVELDAARRPGAAQGDLAELHDVIGIEEVAPGRLVGGAPDLAADLGQDGHRDVGILQPHHRPFLVDAGAAELVEEGIGVEPGPVAPHRRAGEDRDGIRVAVGIGLEDFALLADRGGAGGAGRAAAGRERGRDQESGQEEGSEAGGLHGHHPCRAHLIQPRRVNQSTRRGDQRAGRGAGSSRRPVAAKSLSKNIPTAVPNAWGESNPPVVKKAPPILPAGSK